MKQTQQGFTLIELMIVVAIIGILAAVALPAYQDYVAKSKITSVVATASSGKSAMFDRYSDLGKMPALSGAAADAIDEADSTTESFYTTMSNLGYQSAVAYARPDDLTGTFEVTLDKINGNVNGKTLVFTYADNGGELKFTCTNKVAGAIKAKYLPAQCS
ncbi:MAG: pilin [Thiotrichales bacterium]